MWWPAARQVVVAPAEPALPEKVVTAGGPAEVSEKRFFGGAAGGPAMIIFVIKNMMVVSHCTAGHSASRTSAAYRKTWRRQDRLRCEGMAGVAESLKGQQFILVGIVVRTAGPAEVLGSFFNPQD